MTHTATLDVGYPIYGSKFINNKTILTIGGGGEGNNGIPNKITAIKCSFQADQNHRLQRFREIVLPANEDSPMCVDVARIPDDDGGSGDFSVFIGCNQSSELIKSMNVNNNLRKYVYTSDEHLRFVDAVQFDESVLADDVGEYPKTIALSSNSSVGCMMTSKIPSSIYIFNPDSTDLLFVFKPEADVEIKDFHLSPLDEGKTLCYITSATVETISTVTSNVISSSNTTPAHKVFSKYILSKVRFVDDDTVIVTGAARNGKGVSIFRYSISQGKILRHSEISKKVKGIVAIDFNLPQNLIALAGNDFSVILLRLSDFKLLKVHKGLHKFAITTLSFSPNGSKLATGSAANSLHVMKIAPNFARGKSTIGTLLSYLIYTVVVAVVGIVLQKAHESGDLERAFELSKTYGTIAFDVAKTQALAGYELAREKLKRDNDGDDSTMDYFKIDSWDEPSKTIEIIDTYTESAQPTLNDEVVVEEVTGEVDSAEGLAHIKEAISTQTTIKSTSEESETPEVTSETSIAAEADEPTGVEESTVTEVASVAADIESEETTQETEAAELAEPEIVLEEYTETIAGANDTEVYEDAREVLTDVEAELEAEAEAEAEQSTGAEIETEQSPEAETETVQGTEAESETIAEASPVVPEPETVQEPEIVQEADTVEAETVPEPEASEPVVGAHIPHVNDTTVSSDVKVETPVPEDVPVPEAPVEKFEISTPAPVSTPEATHEARAAPSAEEEIEEIIEIVEVETDDEGAEEEVEVVEVSDEEYASFAGDDVEYVEEIEEVDGDADGEVYEEIIIEEEWSEEPTDERGYDEVPESHDQGADKSMDTGVIVGDHEEPVFEDAPEETPESAEVESVEPKEASGDQVIEGIALGEDADVKSSETAPDAESSEHDTVASTKSEYMESVTQNEAETAEPETTEPEATETETTEPEAPETETSVSVSTSSEEITSTLSSSESSPATSVSTPVSASKPRKIIRRTIKRVRAKPTAPLQDEL